MGELLQSVITMVQTSVSQKFQDFRVHLFQVKHEKLIGDVQRILVESTVIAPHHAREIRSALNDVITECRIAKESLQPLAAHRDMTKYAPLFSLKNLPGEEKNRPPRSWWKFWKKD